LRRSSCRKAAAQAQLRRPGAGQRLSGDLLLAFAQGAGDEGAVMIGPGRLHQLEAQVLAAGAGDVAAPETLTGGAFAGHQPGEGRRPAPQPDRGRRSSRWVASAGRLGHGVQAQGQLSLKGPLDAAGTTQPVALALEGEIAMWDARAVERLGHELGLDPRHDGVVQPCRSSTGLVIWSAACTGERAR
jgi:hypothetical protein